ncbi:MAG TPA: pyridoxal phosphate-dependent aminotransferase [Candidatus Kapabacteria bacterium]|nr:pyridoxal phosphate-dependent aminotransferase [Candidatus Kapabacteria bacterium]
MPASSLDDQVFERAIGKHSIAKRMDNVTEAATLRIAERARELRESGRSIVSLSTGEPNFPTPQHIKDAAVRALANDQTRYTPAEGMKQLREIVAEKFKRDNRIDTSWDRIQISSGGKHALSNAISVLVQQGDEVIIPSPYWVSYPAMVALADGTPVYVETHLENEWLMRPEDLERACTDRTRVLILNTPVNPTSSMYSEGQLRALAEVIERRNIYVVVDELYEKLVYDGRKHFSIGAIDAIADQVVTVNGLSKAYAMTGWRCGYATGPKQVIDAMNRLQSQAVSHPSSITQCAAIEALSQSQEKVEEMRSAFERRRDLVVKLMLDIPGIHFTKPKGAFYIFFDISSFIGKSTSKGVRIRSAEDICLGLLDDHGIALVPGNAFGKDDAIRLSFAASEQDIEEGVKRIREGLAEIK